MQKKIINIISRSQQASIALLAFVFAFFFAFPSHPASILTLSVPVESNNDYSVEHQRDQILIKFDHALLQKPAPLNSAASDLISDLSISEDGKTLILKTLKPLNLSANRGNNELILNIQPKFVADESPTAKTADPISLSFGEHQDYYRFVFEYQNKPLYTLQKDADSVSLYFLDKVLIHPENLDRYPHHAALLQSKNASGSVNFTIPSPLLQAREYGNKIIIDVSKKAPGKQKSDSDKALDKIIGQEQSIDSIISKASSGSDKSSISLGQLPHVQARTSGHQHQFFVECPHRHRRI